MISVNDFKTGLTISVDDAAWKVIDFQHVKPGKGSASVRSRLRSLKAGAIQKKTFGVGEKVEPAMIENRRMQHLYADGDNHVFMGNESPEQTEPSSDYLKEELNYLKESMEVQIQVYEGETVGVESPKTIELTVTGTEPDIRGDTAIGATKSAIVETGYTLSVPLFINEDDVLIVNVGDGGYISRG